MNILDAAHMIGHEYPGGAGPLADRMGVGHVVFNNKINPNNTTHHLTLVESLRMQQLAGRNDVLFAMAEALGFVCMPMPQLHHENVDREVAKLCKEFGEYIASVSQAIEDGNVTGNELKRCEHELSELIGVANALQATLGEMNRRRAPAR